MYEYLSTEGLFVALMYPYNTEKGVLCIFLYPPPYKNCRLQFPQWAGIFWYRKSAAVCAFHFRPEMHTNAFYAVSVKLDGSVFIIPLLRNMVLLNSNTHQFLLYYTIISTMGRHILISKKCCRLRLSLQARNAY